MAASIPTTPPSPLVFDVVVLRPQLSLLCNLKVVLSLSNCIIIIIGMPQRGALPLPCQSARSLGSAPLSRPLWDRRCRHGRLWQCPLAKKAWVGAQPFPCDMAPCRIFCLDCLP